MTAVQFCYWLQGMFEISGPTGKFGLSMEQVEIIKNHLALVFAHDIDPQAGPPEHQALLNHLHSPTDKIRLRC